MVKPKLRTHNLKKGTTLIEMLIYMILLSSFLVVLSQALGSALDVQLEAEAQSAVTADGRYMVARLLHDIARADSIILPASAGAQGSDLNLSIGGVTYAYSLTAGNLTLTDSQGPENLNSFDTSVSALTFRRLGNTGGKHTIAISFTLTSRVTRPGLGRDARTFQTTGGLR